MSRNGYIGQDLVKISMTGYIGQDLPKCLETGILGGQNRSKRVGWGLFGWTMSNWVGMLVVLELIKVCRNRYIRSDGVKINRKGHISPEWVKISRMGYNGSELVQIKREGCIEPKHLYRSTDHLVPLWFRCRSLLSEITHTSNAKAQYFITDFKQSFTALGRLSTSCFFDSVVRISVQK